METSENIILKLNEILEGDEFHLSEFNYLLNELLELENLRIVLFDFEYYNEDRLRVLQESKIECVRVQEFEEAAKYRKLEAECQEYIDIKEEYCINKSLFYIEKEYLFYFYFGISVIAKLVKENLKNHLQK
jgi:hypothetical protein